MPDAGAEVVDEARSSGAAEPATERASLRLAAFGALLIVVLVAGYGLGRLSGSMPPSPGGTPATQRGGAATTPARRTTGTEPAPDPAAPPRTTTPAPLRTRTWPAPPRTRTMPAAG